MKITRTLEEDTYTVVMTEAEIEALRHALMTETSVQYGKLERPVRWARDPMVAIDACRGVGLALATIHSWARGLINEGN